MRIIIIFFPFVDISNINIVDFFLLLHIYLLSILHHIIIYYPLLLLLLILLLLLVLLFLLPLLFLLFLFNRFAHSAGPGREPQRVEAVGGDVDGLMRRSKGQVRSAI